MNTKALKQLRLAAPMGGAWVSPTGKFFNLPGGTHLQWLRANDPMHLYSPDFLKIMEKQFNENQGLEKSTQKQEDDIFREYLKAGWTRVFLAPIALHVHVFKYDRDQIIRALTAVYDNQPNWNMKYTLEIFDEGATNFGEEITNDVDEEGYEIGLLDAFKNSIRHPRVAKTDFRKKISAADGRVILAADRLDKFKAPFSYNIGPGGKIIIYDSRGKKVEVVGSEAEAWQRIQQLNQRNKRASMNYKDKIISASRIAALKSFSKQLKKRAFESDHEFAGTKFNAEWVKRPNEDGVEVMFFNTHADVEDRILDQLSNELGYIYHDPKYNAPYVLLKDVPKLRVDMEERNIRLPYNVAKLRALKTFAAKLRKKAYDDDYDDDRDYDDGYGEYIDGMAETVTLELIENGEVDLSDVNKEDIQAVVDSVLEGLRESIQIPPQASEEANEEAFETEYNRLAGILEAEAKAWKKRKEGEDAERNEAEANSQVTVNLFYGTLKIRTWRDRGDGGSEGGSDSKFIPEAYVANKQCMKKDVHSCVQKMVEAAKATGLEDESEEFRSDSNTYFGESGGYGGINESYKTFNYTITQNPDNHWHDQEM